MGFRTGNYATIWQVKKGSGNYTDVRLSTSKKNRQTEQYETDFSGYVRFVGTAHQNAGSLKERDRIKIGDCEVTNHYDKEKNVTYTNFAIYSFENANNRDNSTQSKKEEKSNFVDVPADVDEELPFN